QESVYTTSLLSAGGHLCNMLAIGNYDLALESMTPSKILFSLHRNILDLHSFPTRRSSDLPPVPTLLYDGAGPGPLTLTTIGPYRSEEHTSELQSRENIVCRLLLEKKKKINRGIDEATQILQNIP